MLLCLHCRDLIDLVFNLCAYRTNASMQYLTVVSVLFLPLTFLAGVYGARVLPELSRGAPAPRGRPGQGVEVRTPPPQRTDVAGPPRPLPAR